MTLIEKPTPRPSRRWEPIEQDPHDGYYTARLTYELPAKEHAAGLEPQVFGPDPDACLRETRRQDHLWVDLAVRGGDHELAQLRMRCLARGEEADR
mgnify:CR=1 FL=1